VGVVVVSLITEFPLPVRYVTLMFTTTTLGDLYCSCVSVVTDVRVRSVTLLFLTWVHC